MGTKGTVVSEGTHIAIRLDTDIVVACQKGRALAAKADFSANDQVVVVIAITEVARNILKYAGHGHVRLNLARQSGRVGLVVVAQDDGPGIANIEQALQDGFSTGQSLGLGLPGAKRLMDEFEIVSAVGQGTTVRLTKWKK
jgi:serine/threonine-protein kinase RsbT